MKTALRFKFAEIPHVTLASIQLLLMLIFAPLAFSQDNQNLPPQPEFSQQELDQMLAPIALYPDALLSQVLMASTYPLEVVQAARWSRAHPELKGDDAVKAVEKNNWDPSVISLTAFPQVLAQMDEKLDWTERLGDAFLAQEPQVMDTVQDLRQKASAAGNLQSNDQIHVEQGQAIVIEQAAPQVIYVPYYNPTVVYGPWWWDAYPPVYWDPWPGYYYQPGFSTTFYWGSGISISGGFFFSNFDWHRRHVNIVNVHNYYYNNYYANPRHSNPYSHDRDGFNRPSGDVRNTNDSEHEWRHDPGHRHGVPYREPALEQQFGRARVNSGVQRNFQNRDQSSRGTNRQSTARPENGSRSGTDTNQSRRTEHQSNGQAPDSRPAEQGNKYNRLDNRNNPDNRGTRQRNVTPVDQPRTSANPNGSDTKEANRPVITRTPDNASPITYTPEPSSHASGGDPRSYQRPQAQPDSRNGGAVPGQAAPAQRPITNNAESRGKDNNHNGANRGNQDHSRDNGSGQDRH